MTRTIDATITYLEMTAPPIRRSAAPLGPMLALMRADEMPLHFYRYLYREIGRNHHWVERHGVSDETLSDMTQAEGIEISVLYADGVPAGYFEIDERDPDAVNVAYLGLMPEWTGRGLGPYLLTCALDRAWRDAPEKVTINTNTLDHPAALPLYQKFGFSPVGQEKKTFEIPHDF